MLHPSKLRLEFTDPFTRDLVYKEENRKLLLETVSSVFEGDVEVELGVSERGKSGIGKPLLEPFEKKTVYNDEQNCNSESQIIQDALDIVGGKVIE